MLVDTVILCFTVFLFLEERSNELIISITRRNGHEHQRLLTELSVCSLNPVSIYKEVLQVKRLLS